MAQRPIKKPLGILHPRLDEQNLKAQMESNTGSIGLAAVRRYKKTTGPRPRLMIKNHWIFTESTKFKIHSGAFNLYVVPLLALSVWEPPIAKLVSMQNPTAGALNKQWQELIFYWPS